MTAIHPQWVTYGVRHGWMWRGTIPAKELQGASFAVQATRVACTAEGGCIDAVQCYDTGIMTAGPIGATAMFGALARLLAEIAAPVRERHLGALCESRHLGLREGANPAFTVGLRTATKDELRKAFLGDSDQAHWEREDAEAQLALEWTVALAELMGDLEARRAIATASAKTILGYLAPAAAKILGCDATAISERPAVRRAIACHLAFAINNPRGALAVLQLSGPDADRMLDVASQSGPWPVTFPQRVTRTRVALAAEVW